VCVSLLNNNSSGVCVCVCVCVCMNTVYGLLRMLR